MWVSRIIKQNNKSKISSIGSFNQKNPQEELPAPHKPPKSKEITINIYMCWIVYLKKLFKYSKLKKLKIRLI